MEIAYFPAVFFQTSWDNQLSRAINNILFEIIFFVEICSLCPRYFEANISCILFLMNSCQICTICFIYLFAEIVDIFYGTCGQYLNLLSEYFFQFAVVHLMETV